MREIKHRMETFSIYDRSGLERHLARMAGKGWLLEKIGSFFWTYRRTEPKTLTFSVCYFPKASQFDPEPSEEQQTFYDFCEHTGWILAASSGQLQVFCNERPNPIPIETDPVMEVDAIHRTMKRSMLPSQLVLLAVAVLNAVMLGARLLDDPIGVLASPASLFTATCWAMVFLLVGVELTSYFRWRRRAVLAAEHGEFWETRSHRKLQTGCMVMLAVGLVYFLASVFSSGNRMSIALTVIMFCVYVPGIFLLVNGVRGFLKRRKASARFNMVVTIVSVLVAAYALMGVIVFGAIFGSEHGWFDREEEETYEAYGRTYTLRQDDIPLTLEDLTGRDYSSYARERRTDESSILLGRLFCIQEAPLGDRGKPWLTYVVTSVKVPQLYDFCKGALFRSQEEWASDEPDRRYFYQAVDAAPWGAVEAYRGDGYEYGKDILENSFLLCYRDRIVCVNFDPDWVVTPEQMAVVGERLGQGEL